MKHSPQHLAAVQSIQSRISELKSEFENPLTTPTELTDPDAWGRLVWEVENLQRASEKLCKAYVTFEALQNLNPQPLILHSLKDGHPGSAYRWRYSLGDFWRYSTKDQEDQYEKLVTTSILETLEQGLIEQCVKITLTCDDCGEAAGEGILKLPSQEEEFKAYLQGDLSLFSHLFEDGDFYCERNSHEGDSYGGPIYDNRYLLDPQTRPEIPQYIITERGAEVLKTFLSLQVPVTIEENRNLQRKTK